MSIAVPVVDSWNGSTRRIYLKQGIAAFHWIDDIYKEYRNWRRTDESARVWAPLMEAAGNNPKGGGKYTPRYITLLEGCRVVPYDENILTVVTGEAITDNADVDPDPFDTSTRTQALKLYITPPASELVRAVAEIAAVQRMSFDGCVTYDAINGTAGTDGLKGNKEYPSNNLTDTLAIAVARELDTIAIIGNMTLGATDDVSGYKLKGQGASINTSKTIITMTAGCTTSNTFIHNASVQGVQGGECVYIDCVIEALSNTHCQFDRCVLLGPVQLYYSTDSWLATHNTDLRDCHTSLAQYVLDYNDSPMSQAYTNFSGRIKITNFTNAGAMIVIRALGAEIEIDTSCTGGTIELYGLYELKDYSTGTTVESEGWSTGASVITAQDITDIAVAARAEVMGAGIEGEITLEQLMRLIASVHVGHIVRTGDVFSIQVVNASPRERIAGTVNADGCRTITNLDVEP